MPIIKRRILSDGPIVRVSVGWSESQARELRLAKRPVPVRVVTKALIDTGAEITCFDPALIESLQLPVKGYFLANAPGLEVSAFTEQYDASLTILRRSSNPNLHFSIPDLAIMRLPLNVLGYEMIIGRDVLAQCSMLYDGARQVFALKY